MTLLKGTNPNLQKLCDFLGATSAGAWLGVFLGWTRSSGNLHDPDFIRCIVIATISFAVPSALLAAMDRERIWRVPTWFFQLLIGVAISQLAIVDIPNLLHAWRFKENSSVTKFLQAEMPETLIGFFVFLVVDTLLCLPVMIPFHFLPKLFPVARPPAGSTPIPPE